MIFVLVTRLQYYRKYYMVKGKIYQQKEIRG